jgi:hypothetical protein
MRRLAELLGGGELDSLELFREQQRVLESAMPGPVFTRLQREFEGFDFAAALATLRQVTEGSE